MALVYGCMDTPRSLDVGPTQALIGKLSRAAAQIDAVSLSALFAILVGWFFSDSLTVTLGSLRHGVRFFDMSAAIADPTRIFFGVDGSFQRLFFGLICCMCLLAPLLAHWRGVRWAWLAYTAPADAGSLGGSAIRFANDLLHRGSGLVSKHVSVGVGGYLAFAGSLVLATQGLRQLRRHAP
jgi:hypothetical protein